MRQISVPLMFAAVWIFSFLAFLPDNSSIGAAAALGMPWPVDAAAATFVAAIFAGLMLIFG